MRKQQLRKQKNIQRYQCKNKEMLENTNTLLTEKVFYNWMEDNMDSFLYKPCFLFKKDSRVTYTFEGICKKITLEVELSIPEAMICYSESDAVDELWSMHKVLEYIGWEKYDPEKGYYDADREDGNYTYFPTKAELYINEVFETILKYCQEYFKPNMNIYTSKRLNSFTATIASKTLNAEERREWWGGTLFFGDIQGDDKAVNYLKDHDNYVQSFDLLSCEEN